MYEVSGQGQNPAASSAATTFTRAWAACMIVTWVWRAGSLVETRSTAGVIAHGSLGVAQSWPLTPGQAGAVWLVLIAGALVTGATTGQRWLPRVGIFAAGSAALLLNLEEALNLKAYDRLITWQALVLLAAPLGGARSAAESGPTGREADEDPRTAAGFARYALLIVYSGLYGSTGWLKVLFEPTWWTGGTLTGFLVDTSFGLRPLGLLAGANSWLLAPVSWLTLVFETAFPVLVWWRPARRVLLVLGVAMHLGIFALMNVGPFSMIALAAYPLMLGERDWAKLTDWVARRRLLTPVAIACAAWCAALALPLTTRGWLPREEAPFRVPDPAIRASIIAALTDPAAHPVQGGERSGEHGQHTITAPSNPKTAGERAAVAVVAVLDERGVDLTRRELTIASLGRISVVPGTQRWPGVWGWVLPDVGDFVTVQGEADWLRPCLVDAGVSVVDTHRVLSRAGRAPTLTDTGTYRQPAREPGTPDVELLDVSGLTRIVGAIEACS